MPVIHLKQPVKTITYRAEMPCDDPTARRFMQYFNNGVIKVPKSNIAYEEEGLPCLRE